MSCKPMYKVQEDVASLKQLLSIVSNGLQRNACAVEKLKKEMTQVRGGGQERVGRYVKGQEYTKVRGKATMSI